MLTVAPRRVRGGHYHTHKTEWFCCTHGACVLILTDIATGMQLTAIELSDTNRVFVSVNPREAHIVLNHHDCTCELLVISSEEYNPENPDTITYGIEH
jgi:UDP-2-acetamido-2,6-beta-L-arabino-hexul-4-ose reductase